MGKKGNTKPLFKHDKGPKLKKMPKPNQVLDAFFKLQVPLNPPTVLAPPPIRHLRPSQYAWSTAHLIAQSPISLPSPLVK
jgi:hypothetical protein